jgi:hydrogenase nickel incorporation protein HypA/HybF
MHEQSLVRNLLRQVDEICRQNGGQVTEVCVQVGPLSGVEPILLASAFEQLAPSSSASDSKLVIEEVSLLANCESCTIEFEIQNFVFRCPRCQGKVNVTRGDTCQLISVSLCETPTSSSDQNTAEQGRDTAHRP